MFDNEFMIDFGLMCANSNYSSTEYQFPFLLSFRILLQTTINYDNPIK